MRVVEGKDVMRATLSWMVFTAVLLSGCAAPPRPSGSAADPLPVPPPPTAISAAPVAPAAPAKPTQAELDQLGQRELEDGVAAYEKGDFSAASEKLVNSSAIASASVPIRLSAHKFAAFSYCVTRRLTLCRAQFEAALKLDPAFDLPPAERGHPLWGPVFDRTKKAQAAAATKK